LLAEEADAAFAHVLNSAEHGRLGFFFGFERQNLMGLDFQDLGKSGVDSTIRFQGAFHDQRSLREPEQTYTGQRD